jgi:hypothetical protein
MRRWEDNIETNPRDVDSEDGKLAEWVECPLAS